MAVQGVAARIQARWQSTKGIVRLESRGCASATFRWSNHEEQQLARLQIHTKHCESDYQLKEQRPNKVLKEPNAWPRKIFEWERTNISPVLWRFSCSGIVKRQLLRVLIGQRKLKNTIIFTRTRDSWTRFFLPQANWYYGWGSRWTISTWFIISWHQLHSQLSADNGKASRWTKSTAISRRFGSARGSQTAIEQIATCRQQEAALCERRFQMHFESQAKQESTKPS